MTQDKLREKIKDIVDEHTTMVVGKIFEMVVGFELEESLKPDINSTTDTILSLIQQAEVKGKREVLQELLDWHEFYDSQKYTPPRREFDWQAAIENMLLQKDYPHGPIVRLAELEEENVLRQAVDMSGNEFAMGYNDSGCFWSFYAGQRGAGAMIGDPVFTSESPDPIEALKEYIAKQRDQLSNRSSDEKRRTTKPNEEQPNE